MKTLLRKKWLGLVGALAAVTAVPSQAALDAAVTTTFTNVTADITEAGVLIISLAAVAMGIRWVKATFF